MAFERDDRHPYEFIWRLRCNTFYFYRISVEELTFSKVRLQRNYMFGGLKLRFFWISVCLMCYLFSGLTFGFYLLVEILVKVGKLNESHQHRRKSGNCFFCSWKTKSTHDLSNLGRRCQNTCWCAVGVIDVHPIFYRFEKPRFMNFSCCLTLEIWESFRVQTKKCNLEIWKSGNLEVW